MNILFLCVANSARSQIAEALARDLFGDKHAVASAGSMPERAINRLAEEVLEEIGIRINGHAPKRIDDLPSDFIKGLDLVVTLCAEEVCPLVQGNVKRLHWGLLDPAAVEGNTQTRLDAFRRTRDEISNRLRQLGDEISQS